jgi:hypothetical protein
MNTHSQTPPFPLRSRNASALLAAAVVSTTLAVMVGGFLSYLNHEYYINFRSYHWTQALHLAEAGIEEGFYEMNYRHEYGSGFLASNGWQPIGGVIAALQPLRETDAGYSKTVTNLTDADGNIIGNYTVQVINPDSDTPYILAQGSVANAPYGIQVTRLTKTVLERGALFSFGLFSKAQISGNGNIYTDSYVSNNPAYSTNGQYTYSKRRGNGDIATNSTDSNAISLVGNAEVNGSAAVGPGGSLTVGGNASVGPLGTPSGQVAEGYFRNDMAMDVPDAELPADFSTLTATAKGNITTSQTLTSGDYWATAVNLSGTNKVTFSGNVRLYVTGDFSSTGNALVTLIPGSKVEIYCVGSFSISGNGDINKSSTPDKLQIFGVGASASFVISGNGEINAAVYAPRSNVTISGNGDISGAVIANSITLNGNANFHYDEALKQTGPPSGYRVRSWEEISIAQQ